MSLSHDRCVALTIVVMTFYIATCQGQANTCDINSRPHPQGICGQRLARAHSNLCFLLRQAYPKHFPGKRSVDNRSVVDRIYNIPLSVLAELDVRTDNWATLLNTRENPYALLNTAVNVHAGEPDSSPVSNQLDYIDMTDLTRSMLQVMGKRSYRTRRNVPQSSMVCDCCYNICTPRHLATYC